MLEKYNSLIDKGKIKKDNEQLKIVHKLQDLITTLENYKRSSGIIGKFLGKIEPPPTHGIYIYGGVGRGKSMLMDMFFEDVPVKAKVRVHFHAFMIDVHNRLHRWRKSKNADDRDPIPHIASDLAREAWLICFDEFQVTDIADAMILSRLFKALFEEGAVVIATSNRPPDDLYKDGLQRQSFTPFIELFKQKVDVVELAGELDHRMEFFKSISTVYFTPLGKKANKFMDKTFSVLTNKQKPEQIILDINGRKLNLDKTYNGVAHLSFEDICAQALGAGDYIEISRKFRTILLEDIPQLTKEKRNEAKRFVLLIDELYEHKVKLICSAEVEPDELYPSGDGSFEFKRTASRLIEMQSEEYLGTEHLA